MNQPYLVVNIVEGELATILQCDTKEEANDTAVEMAHEQGDVLAGVIRLEIEQSGNFTSRLGDIKVYVIPFPNPRKRRDSALFDTKEMKASSMLKKRGKHP